jgi:hypothetical protein
MPNEICSSAAALRQRAAVSRSLSDVSIADAPTGWTVHVEETSAGVYWVRAEDVSGRAVHLSGTDPEALRAEAVRQIELLDDVS